jgi:multidrug resistance protein
VISQDLGVSISQINLTLTTYTIFQAIAPTVFGDFSDKAGRRPAFLISFTLFFFANIGLAFQRNYIALLILRCLQSSGSSGTLAMGYAAVADIASSDQRGKYLGFVGTGITVGPALGPVLGGLLTEYIGWPAIFWFLAIFTVVWLIPYTLFVPETCRKIVGDGSIRPQGWNMTLMDFIRREKGVHKDAVRRKIQIPNPLKSLRIIGEKDLAIILFYNGILFVAFMITGATLSPILVNYYGFNNLQSGLSYLPLGAAGAIASISQGYVLDWNFRRLALKGGFEIGRGRGLAPHDFPIEKCRLQLVYPTTVLGSVAFIAFGWVFELRKHIAIPLTISFFIGLFMTSAFQILNALVVDLYPHAPATATGANNLVRCLLGAIVSRFPFIININTL